MLVTQPLGSQGRGTTHPGISNPQGSLLAVCAVTYRHFGESPHSDVTAET